MAISVRLPAMLRRGSDTLTITEPVHSIAQLVEVLGRIQPDLTSQLDDAIFNFEIRMQHNSSSRKN